MKVFLRTPDGEVFFRENVSSLDAITELGAMRILPGHAALQGSILFSPVRVETPDHTEHFVVQQGFIFINQHQDEVTFLVYRAEKRGELNHQTAKEYLEHVLKALQDKTSLSEYELRFLDDERLATQERLTYLEHFPPSTPSH